MKSRHSLLIVLCCAYLLCYLDRMAIATALPFIARDFQLSPLAMGSVLSAFFIGYALMQIPGGLLADRFGPHRVMTASIAGWSIFTALTGLAGSLPALLAIRVLFGVAEGSYPPASSKAIALQFPASEVGKANGLHLSAINIGAAIAPLFVAPMIIAWGWRSVFYSLLVPGLVLAVIVWKVARSPAAPIDSSAGAAHTQSEKIPFKTILRMPGLFWCCVALFFANTAGWGLMNWLPTYLLQARGFSLGKTGILASLPFLAGALGCWLSGYLSDKYFKQRRQIPILLGLIAAAGMTLVAATASTGEWAIAALVLAFLCFFVALSGIFTLPLILVRPEGVGGAFGVVNAAGQLAAFLSPLLVGAVLNATDNNFIVVFYGFAGLFLVASGAVLKIRPARVPQ